MTLPVAVIESRWDTQWAGPNNLSVRTFFELLGSIFETNPSSFHYEMFSCKAAFQEIIPRINKDRQFKYAYIGCHGGEDGRGNLGLYAHNGEFISRAVLRNLLGTSGHLRGLYFGSCGFATERLADFIFQGSSSIRWIAGYEKEIDWAESSALDLMFLNLLLHPDRQGYDSEQEKISHLSQLLWEFMSGACEQLGFSIYLKTKRGEVANLISESRWLADASLR